MGVKSALASNETITVTNFSFQFAVVSQDSNPSAATGNSKSDSLPQRLIRCNDSPCSPPFLQIEKPIQAEQSTQASAPTPVEEATFNNKQTQEISESTKFSEPTQVIELSQMSNMSTQINIPSSQTSQPTEVNESNYPLPNICNPVTATVTALPTPSSRISSTRECPSVVITNVMPSTKISNCSAIRACPSGMLTTPVLSEAPRGTGLGAYVGVIAFLGVLIFVIIGSAIITVRLKSRKLLKTGGNRMSSSWWNRTPLGGSATSLIIQPLNTKRLKSEKIQEFERGFREYDTEAQRPKSAYLRMKDDIGEKQRWRDSLSTIPESYSEESEKSLERTPSEKRVGRLFDERTRSKYYRTGDV